MPFLHFELRIFTDLFVTAVMCAFCDVFVICTGAL